MLILGLSGSIGMGKSTAAAMLRQMGHAVHDADATVHRLTARNGPALPAIAAAFPGVVSGGVLDRQKLGAAVFDNPPALRRLEAILHPLVQRAQRGFLRRQAARGAKLVVLDIPLLFEGNGERRCDATIAVSAPSFLQRARVLARPGMSEQKFAAILNQQMPDVLKRRRATYVVPTGQGKAMTRAALKSILRQLRGKRGKFWPPDAGRERLARRAKRWRPPPAPRK